MQNPTALNVHNLRKFVTDHFCKTIENNYRGHYRTVMCINVLNRRPIKNRNFLKIQLI